MNTVLETAAGIALTMTIAATGWLVFSFAQSVRQDMAVKQAILDSKKAS